MADGTITGWRSIADHLDSRQTALCEFAEKLTRTPHAMEPSDLDRLRAEGLDEREIVHVVHVIGYFNHINRVADALGVDPETFMPDTE